jgi:hypothetical protein
MTAVATENWEWSLLAGSVVVAVGLSIAAANNWLPDLRPVRLEAAGDQLVLTNRSEQQVGYQPMIVGAAAFAILDMGRPVPDPSRIVDPGQQSRFEARGSDGQAIKSVLWFYVQSVNGVLINTGGGGCLEPDHSAT